MLHKAFELQPVRVGEFFYLNFLFTPVNNPSPRFCREALQIGWLPRVKFCKIMLEFVRT